MPADHNLRPVSAAAVPGSDAPDAPDATDQLLKAAVAECAQYERMLSAVRKANEDWSQRYHRLIGDFQRLTYSALSINDRLRVHADHVEFTGSMNDAQDFHELVNDLHWKHADEFTDDVLERDAGDEGMF